MRPEIPAVLLNVNHTCLPLFFAKPQAVRSAYGNAHTARKDLRGAQ